MTTKCVSLADQSGWDELERLISENQENPRLSPYILSVLRELGAKAFILEEGYLDRDFSEAYSNYYSKLFKRHSKLCKRIAFFSNDLAEVSNETDVGVRARRLQEIGVTEFLGWVTLRPIHSAPIAQIVLRPVTAPSGYEGHLLVRASYTIHLLGAELTIESSALTQQDQRIGACAQAAIWSAARHFHIRYKGPWVSTVSITESALMQSDAVASTTLPNGSEFLSLNGMVSALKAVGRKPLLYGAESIDPATQRPVWTGVRPADVINRYVDSGIPVIAGLSFPGQSIGHAVLAVGQILAQSTPIGVLPTRPTRAEFCDGFIVNDDQWGPHLRMGKAAGSSIAQTTYNVSENVGYLLIALPDKVFVPAEKAEQLAWDLLGEYCSTWPALSSANSSVLKASVGKGNGVVDAFANNEIIARTYLTYGWKYHHRTVRNSIHAKVKAVALDTSLPKYVWVTEFGTRASFSHADKFQRRIFAHCVVDATAKSMGADCRLFFHAPGLCYRLVHDETNPAGPYRKEIFPVEDDVSYFPKLRGNNDFTGYS